ncbi:hypothetical protein Cgig2_017561 [Carnegiea gigantea]|uniref:Uncharacterized protein n=1 Tax=Carnegiea gigantea TaxID=171969 RepID=A0A9Q1KM38_9CARY|nr:hypothetical protein Cgig2_017561 [Carnegiea gigantea]
MELREQTINTKQYHTTQTTYSIKQSKPISGDGGHGDGGGHDGGRGGEDWGAWLRGAHESQIRQLRQQQRRQPPPSYGVGEHAMGLSLPGASHATHPPQTKFNQVKHRHQLQQQQPLQGAQGACGASSPFQDLPHGGHGARGGRGGDDGETWDQF